MHSAPFLRLLPLASLAAAPCAAIAQSEGGLTPAARLEQLDETYTSNLRRYHGPIIQDYLLSLEKLKQTFVQRGRTDAAAVTDAEIQRTRKLSTGSGLLPYDILKPPPPESKPDRPPAPKPPGDKPPKKGTPPGAIIFAATTAKPVSPDAATLPEKPDGRAVPVGSAEWQIEKIPAGEYRISILYSCAGKPADTTILAQLGENSVRHALTAANATGGINEFRIARLGVISLEKDATGEKLVLQNSDPAAAAIWVRQVIIARVSEGDTK